MTYRRKAISDAEALARTTRRGEGAQALRAAFGVSIVAGIVANAALLVLTAAGAI